MARKQRTERREEARALLGAGASAVEAAQAVGVAPDTVRRWKREDLAPPDAPVTEQVARRLEARLARLVERAEAQPDAEDDGHLEDRMLKITRVLDSLRGGRDVITEQLQAMHSFAAFCLRTLDRDEVAVVRKAVHLFVDELKREHS